MPTNIAGAMSDSEEGSHISDAASDYEEGSHISGEASDHARLPTSLVRLVTMPRVLASVARQQVRVRVIRAHSTKRPPDSCLWEISQ